MFVTYTLYEPTLSMLNSSTRNAKLMTEFSGINPKDFINVYVHGDELPKLFDGTSCQITPRKSIADIVLFNMITYNLPYIKTAPSQVLIFYQSESPIYTEQLNRKPTFHGGISYLQKSLVYHPYGWIHDSRNDRTISPPLFKNIKYIALWFVSHCKANSKRDIMANQLTQILGNRHMHIFGDCGKETPCSREYEFSDPLQYNKCVTNLSKDYMFYLSFENSKCEDYITEKFFNALLRGLIPIALGGKNGREDYQRLGIPDSAYVHVNDFLDIKSLANYLELVFKNQTLFNYHHEWRKTHSIVTNDYSYSQSPVLKELSKICNKDFINKFKNRKPTVLFDEVWGRSKCV